MGCAHLALATKEEGRLVVLGLLGAHLLILPQVLLVPLLGFFVVGF